MEIKHYQSIIEAVLFASGEPVELTRLAEAIEIDTDTAERLTEALMHETNARPGGIRIVRLGRCYQMCTRLEYASYTESARHKAQYAAVAGGDGSARDYCL